MYTREGQEVLVRHEIAGKGFLVVPVLETWDSDLVEGALMMVDAVYERAPTARFDAKVVELEGEIRKLHKQKNALRVEMREAERKAEERRAKFKQLEALQNLEDFISGRITHYVVDIRWRMSRIVAFGDAVSSYDRHGKKLLILFGDSKGNLTWKLNQYSDGSGSYSDVLPCLSHGEAVEKLTVILHERMEKVVTRAMAEHAEEQGVPLPPGYMERVEEAEREDKEKKIAGLRKQIEELERAR